MQAAADRFMQRAWTIAGRLLWVRTMELLQVKLVLMVSY